MRTLASHSESVMKVLFVEGSATRAEISKRLGVRKNTIGETCNNLLKDGRIEKAGGGKKRNIKLQLHPSRFLALGVDHTLNGLLFTGLKADRTIVFQDFLPLKERSTGLVRMKQIASLVRGILARKTDAQQVAGVGYCDIGMFDFKEGRSIRAAFLPGWEGIPVRDPLEDATGQTVTFLGKIDACSQAEQVFGNSKDQKNLIFVMVDQTIGLSVRIGGQFLWGDTSIFGELGHVVVDPAGSICRCGNRGCLETVAASDAIVKKVRDHLPPGGETPFERSPEKITIEKIMQAAQQGHKLATLAIQEASSTVGNTMAQVLSILGIQQVVFAGVLPQAGDLFLGPVRTAIQQRCPYPLNTQIRISVSSMGPFGSSLGAAYHVLQNHFTGQKREAAS